MKSPRLFAYGAPAALVALILAFAAAPAFADDDSRVGFSLSFGTGLHGRHHGLHGRHHGLHGRHHGLHGLRHHGLHNRFRHSIHDDHHRRHHGIHHDDHLIFHNDIHFPRTYRTYRYRSSPLSQFDRYPYTHRYPRPNTAVIVIPPRQRTTSVYSTTQTQTIPPLSTTRTLTTTTYADGWSYLGRESHDARTAVNAFALQCERSPAAGLPRVGYAISQALLGNDEKAVWAMRRALVCEPESLEKVDLDANLRTRISELINGYDTRVREGFSRSDDLFMLAALRYIQGEYAAAYPVINAAIKQGDAEPTTQTLNKLIDAKYQQ